MIRRLLRTLGLAGPEVPCWCGTTHPAGYWHDPTHGRIDRDIQDHARDIQDHARDLYEFEPHATRLQMGETAIHVAAAENNLQRKRDAGEVLYWEKPF